MPYIQHVIPDIRHVISYIRDAISYIRDAVSYIRDAMPDIRNDAPDTLQKTLDFPLTTGVSFAYSNFFGTSASNAAPINALAPAIADRRERESLMKDYLPASDTEFVQWLENFIEVLKGLQAALGLAPATVTALETSLTNLKTKLAAISSLQAQLAAAFEDKNTEIETLRDATRALVRTLQANPQLKDSDRAQLGITVPDTVRTPVGVPTTHPIAQIDVSQPLRHTGEFRDEATPNRRAKPAGVHGCEVRYQIGGAEPVDPNTMLTLGTFPKSPFVKDFNVADAGKLVFYYLRWVNKRGAAGPWSELISATITRKG